MKSVLIIGLGRFGSHMAKKLMEQGNEVLGIDIDEEKVNDALSYVTNAQIGDSTNERFIEHLGVGNFDFCVVAIGDNFQSSLETTALLKDHGARFVLARACRDVHAKFLLRNGADQIAYAERDSAERFAAKLGMNNIFDYIELGDGYSIYEITTPKPWIGKSILQQSVRSKYNVSILAVKRNNEVLIPMPKPEYVFNKDEMLMVLGHMKDVNRITHIK